MNYAHHRDDQNVLVLFGQQHNNEEPWISNGPVFELQPFHVASFTSLRISSMAPVPSLSSVKGYSTPTSSQSPHEDTSEVDTDIKQTSSNEASKATDSHLTAAEQLAKSQINCILLMELPDHAMRLTLMEYPNLWMGRRMPP